MNKEFEPKSVEIEEWGTTKLDVEAFDPKPLEPEDFEDGEKKNFNERILQLEKSRLELLKAEKAKAKSSEAKKTEDEILEAEKSNQGYIAGYRSVINALSLVGQIGLVMFACVAIGLFGGVHLDRWLGTEPLFLLILTLVGVASGFRAVYMMIKKLMD